MTCCALIGLALIRGHWGSRNSSWISIGCSSSLSPPPSPAFLRESWGGRSSWWAACSNGGRLVSMIIMHRHWFIVRAHRITGNGDTGITGMRSGAARGRWRWIVDPIYAASKTGLGNNVHYMETYRRKIKVLPFLVNAVHTDWIYVAGTHGMATVVASMPRLSVIFSGALNAPHRGCSAVCQYWVTWICCRTMWREVTNCRYGAFEGSWEVGVTETLLCPGPDEGHR